MARFQAVRSAPVFMAQSSLIRILFCLSAVGAAFVLSLATERPNSGTSGLFLLMAAAAICSDGRPIVCWAASALAVLFAAYILEPADPVREYMTLLEFAACLIAMNYIASYHWRARHELERKLGDTTNLLTLRTSELKDAKDRLAAELRRRVADQERLASLRAESARLVRTTQGAELAAAVTHEINQPITGLVAQCAAAANWLDHEPPDLEEARNSVQAAIQCAERSAEVVRKVRRLMAREPLPKDFVDLNTVVRSALERSNQVASLGREHVRCELVESLPKVRGDQTALELVIRNLLANAIEAMNCTQSEPDLRVRTFVDGDEVCIVVADAGPGLPAGADVFRPFFSTKPEGIGIGLAICRCVVLAHAGTISCHNKVGGGAVFEVRIPAGVCVHEPAPAHGVRN